MPEKITKAELARAELARTKLEARELANDYPSFFRGAWAAMNPDVPLTESWHYDYIGEWLQYAASGQFRKDHPEMRGMIINVPPRTLKSSEANIYFPAWGWASHPERKFLRVSYGQTFSENEISVPCRKLLESEWYQARWPKTRISTDMNRKDRYDSTAGGYMHSTGCGGSGFGANIVIIDDILQLEEAYTSARDKANQYYQDTLTSRRNDASKDFYIVICQRLHENDLPGYLLKNEPGCWQHIVIPLECEEDTDYVHPISGKLYHRKKGDILLPSRFPQHEIDLRKKNPVIWAGQCQQKPMPDTGNLCDPSWWMYYESDIHGRPLEGSLPSFDMVLYSVDTTFKATKGSDFGCITKQGFIRQKQYILDCVNERMDEIALENRLINLVAADAKLPQNERATILLIEETANGAAVIQRLKRLEHPLPVAIVAVHPEGGKMSRAMAAQPECRDGNCYLPKIAPWLQAFKQQLALGVLAAEHDDMIDSWSQGWAYRREHRWAFFEALEKKAASKVVPTESARARVKGKAPTRDERADASRAMVRAEYMRRLGRRFK
jgi:predicted phage terminase large subunit-like protein